MSTLAESGVALNANLAASAALVWPSLLVALAALAGSLLLSVAMRLKACPLCVYQRTFVMGVAGILAVGLLADPRHHAILNVLALPMAVAGWGVAVFHVYLETRGKMECPVGLLGLGTAPKQSLAVLTLLLLVVISGIVRGHEAEPQAILTSAAGFFVGLLLAWGALASAPPGPPAPTKAYEIPLDICRPPFRGTS